MREFYLHTHHTGAVCEEVMVIVYDDSRRLLIFIIIF